MQGLGNCKDLAVQLIYILMHMDVQQQQPRQGVGEVIFWQIHQAFLTARASSNYNMVAWAKSYHRNHPAQQRPVLIQLSSQIVQWAQRPPEHLQSQAVQPAQPPNQIVVAGVAAANAAMVAETDVVHNATGDAADGAVAMDMDVGSVWANSGNPVDFQPAHNAILHTNSDSMACHRSTMGSSTSSCW